VMRPSSAVSMRASSARRRAWLRARAWLCSALVAGSWAVSRAARSWPSMYWSKNVAMAAMMAVSLRATDPWSG
jgi:hypothetical protein